MLTIIVILLGFAVMIYRWYLLTVLWAWFIVPQFNLPEATFGQIVAASLFWSLFTYKHDDQKTDSQKLFKRMIIVAGVMTLFMGIAWFIKLAI